MKTNVYGEQIIPTGIAHRKNRESTFLNKEQNLVYCMAIWLSYTLIWDEQTLALPLQ